MHALRALDTLCENMEYNFRALEEKWAPIWERDRLFEVDENDSETPRKYVLDMFSYPSGDLHMGHAETYAYGDFIARYWRHRGYNVLHPVGWDSFGLPAENAAIKHGSDPKVWTYRNIDQQARSMRLYAASFDWSRRLHTSDPEYYRWNQWLFLKLYKHGLAYRKKAWVNWDPSDRTVLANEQVLPDGTSERSGALVVKKKLTQWFLRITAYADRLLDDLSMLENNWPERVITMQRNWIGRSEGVSIEFNIPTLKRPVMVFTTRPETIFGVTYLALAFDSEVTEELASKSGVLGELLELRHNIDKTHESVRGLDLKSFAIHPLTGQSIPIFAASYILSDYAKGAVMSVPGHDTRDERFAVRYNLPIVKIMEDNRLISSGKYSGQSVTQARENITRDLCAKALGRREISYRLRDWLISRQRYWGTPIPILYDSNGSEIPVEEDDLPVLLPDSEGIDLTPSGLSPLGGIHDWVNLHKAGSLFRRDTDTMDTFFDSSWYFLRYLNPDCDTAPFTLEKAKKWGPVDQYCGGVEHAVLHLLYARFITKFLYDIGFVDFKEPFLRLINQGMVVLNGAKMSKSKGNIVEFSKEVSQHGVDVIRFALIFSGPPEEDIDWKDVSMTGAARFLSRCIQTAKEVPKRTADLSLGDIELRKHTHSLLNDIDWLVDSYRFNVIAARLMDLLNITRKKIQTIGADNPAIREAIETIAIALDMFSPYTAEEMWEILGNKYSVSKALFPEVDTTFLEQKTTCAIVQIDGRLRGRLNVLTNITTEQLVHSARSLPAIEHALSGRSVKRVICVPPKLVNFVVEPK
ncbi:leucine--tRNA ligase [Tropheryma whipplei]|uniref:leucine--tRNA ligase n=1 Tax=Tropheryma whipplei TaxID=2039 RepID=UPI000571C484|nr:leucine--tRNA ligase [Tropheryma whipplei]